MLRVEVSVSQVLGCQIYTSYLGGKSIHVCIPLCTHVYTTVYKRVHNIALGMSPLGLSGMCFSRAYRLGLPAIRLKTPLAVK